MFLGTDDFYKDLRKYVIKWISNLKNITDPKKGKERINIIFYHKKIKKELNWRQIYL